MQLEVHSNKLDDSSVGP